MTLDSMIMFAGAAVAVLPFLGIPRSIDEYLYTFLGVVVVGLGVALRRKRTQIAAEERAKK